MNSPTSNPVSGGQSTQRLTILARSFASAVVLLTVVFLINNYLNVWLKWPGAITLYSSFFTEDSAPWQAWVLGLSYPLTVLVAIAVTLQQSHRSLMADANLLSDLASYIVRAAFWAIMLIGLVDSIISFIRVEGFLTGLVGEDWSGELGRATYRGTYIHYPLLGVAFIVAAFVRTISVSWLALLVVLAEFMIVIARFIFSYEQAFMGDLVRFWYAGLFLFASAYTLKEEGHVRVDVLYSHLRHSLQARLNVMGILVLGLPLCWVILSLGMWDRTSSLNSPLVSFEISQSGYGLYVKYLMAGYLVIFAVSMMIQFCSYLLQNLAVLTGEHIPEEEHDDHHHVPHSEDRV